MLCRAIVSAPVMVLFFFLQRHLVEGLTAGGVINIVTKKPRTKPQHSVGLAVGTDDFWRAQASSTGPLGQGPGAAERGDLRRARCGLGRQVRLSA